MNYEEFTKGDENPYQSKKDGYITEKDKLNDITKYDEFEYTIAVRVIEEANLFLINQDDYADLETANQAIVEYKEIYIQNKNNTSEKLMEELALQRDLIASLAHSFEERIKIELLNNKEKINTSHNDIKTMLTVKDLADRYAISEAQQKHLRGRIKNPLLFYQDGIGGKIRYSKKEIEVWFEKQKVKRGA